MAVKKSTPKKGVPLRDGRGRGTGQVGRGGCKKPAGTRKGRR